MGRREMAYGKIHVGSPKEQDLFKEPYFFIFHIYDRTNDMSVHDKCKKSKMRGNLKKVGPLDCYQGEPAQLPES
jgi:hypothetical protein